MEEGWREVQRGRGNGRNSQYSRVVGPGCQENEGSWRNMQENEGNSQYSRVVGPGVPRERRRGGMKRRLHYRKTVLRSARDQGTQQVQNQVTHQQVRLEAYVTKKTNCMALDKRITGYTRCRKSVSVKKHGVGLGPIEEGVTDGTSSIICDEYWAKKQQLLTKGMCEGESHIGPVTSQLQLQSGAGRIGKGIKGCGHLKVIQEEMADKESDVTRANEKISFNHGHGLEDDLAKTRVTEGAYTNGSANIKERSDMELKDAARANTCGKGEGLAKPILRASEWRKSMRIREGTPLDATLRLCMVVSEIQRGC
ncbi:hypothetical protein VNO78_01606 [Psophocarpus tetragonolobus]|uniref:Uncharacterized protein n=1 Tax=Psophocarpus tetragonolobus TaxID=3891 RepID=A0AAN9T1R9_PSOTE